MTDAFDQRLSAALHNVRVPEGLRERLLMRLAEDRSAMQGAVAARVPELRSRRWLLAAGGVAAAAAVLFVAVLLGIHKAQGLSEQFVLDQAIQSFDSVTHTAGANLTDKAAPADYPFSPAIFEVRGIRWHSAEAVLAGRRGVVYQFPGTEGTQAALFVVDAESSDEFADSPAVHPFTTAGCCASAWVENGRLYVFVVQGDPSAYRAYLNLPHGPLA